MFDLLARGDLDAHLPSHGMLTLPLAPVLQRVAPLSARCYQRGMEYLHAQQILITRSIASAVLRKDPADREFTAQLRGIADTHSRLLRALQPPTRPAPDADAAESWLGIEQSHPAKA